MKRRGSASAGGNDPTQLHIAWEQTPPAVEPIGPTPFPVVTSPAAMPPPEPEQTLVQRLPWDFKESFPPPLPEALDAGILSDEDTEPESIRAIHDEQARQLLATLRGLNFIGDARRRLFDPKTGEVAKAPEEQERLQKRLFGESQRLELWWQTLVDTYAEAFGEEAADAFGKAVRARNAGIEVIAETRPDLPPLTPPTPRADPVGAAIKPTPPTPDQDSRRKLEPRPSRHPRTTSARFPVPRPLRAAVAAGHFGRDEQGVVRPSAAEVRSITLQHSEKLIELLEATAQASRSGDRDEIARLSEAFRSGIAVYAEDFGNPAAQQLEAFCRRQAHLRATGPGKATYP